MGTMKDEQNNSRLGEEFAPWFEKVAQRQSFTATSALIAHEVEKHLKEGAGRKK